MRDGDASCVIYFAYEADGQWTIPWVAAGGGTMLGPPDDC